MSRIKDSGKKIWIIIAAAVIVLAAGAFFAVKALKPASQPVEAGTETVQIEKMDLVQSLTLSGTVQSGATYAVTSSVSDVEIKSVNVREGDRVQKGDVIAILDDSQLRDSQRTAKNNLSYTKKRNSLDLASAKRSYKNAKQDQAIAAERSKKEVANAKAAYEAAVAEQSSLNSQYAAAQTNTVNVKAQVEPQIEAVKAGIAAEKAKGEAASEEKLEELEKQLEVLEKQITAAEENEEKLASDVKTAAETVVSAKEAYEKAVEDKEDSDLSQKRAVQEQKEALKSAQLSAKESLSSPKEEVSKANKELESCTVRAETGGVVTSVPVKTGDLYKGDTIAVINDDSSYRVSATVDQYDISSLAEGQTADITIKAVDMDNASGRLIHVARTPEVSADGDGTVSSGAEYGVETLITDPPEDLMIGMTAKVVVKVWEKKDCLAVPDSCVQTDENGDHYIEIVNAKGNSRQITVRYGMKTDYYSEIISDEIEEGMEVIVPAETGAAGEEDEDFYY